MGLRDVYNQLEQTVTPIADQITRSEEFAQAISLIGGLNKTLRGQVQKRAAQAWHVLNLPAGTDVQRLRRQVGELDREVRLLTLELQKQQRQGVNRDGVADEAAEHD
jgi:hypothetical protein